ncbi:Tnp_DDE_dom domain-containing protein [Vibrio chagasii]|nr:Tnp_DDE_dom domain-containing protein [Vibrio chagasii]CAH7223914.1 Tnp_DDE_dom domain-containing protein [Vibrio chagasii]CAH7325998.1 Tnp_DDE_dom domain-containing protein [Vibrio chagasii]CAH7340291.1 transposase [Vibrio chagasii]
MFCFFFQVLCLNLVTKQPTGSHIINRGSLTLTFWIDEEAIRGWAQSKQNKRGKPRRFSDLAITTALMVKRVLGIGLGEGVNVAAQIVGS